MSRNIGDGNNTAELKRYILLAAVITLLILSYGAVQHLIYYKNANIAAAFYSDSSQNKIADLCSKIGPENCIDRANEIKNTARVNQREEYDLYSQKSMSLWTAVMGLMSVVGVFLTALGVWFVKRTLDATLRAVADTSKATDAMLQANEISSDGMKRQLRAYMGATQLHVTNFFPNQVPLFRVDFINGGQTPARQFRLKSFVDFALGDPNSHKIKPSEPTPYSVLDVSVGKPVWHVIPLGSILTQQVYDLALSGRGTFVLFGFASYRDIFKDRHILMFRYYIDFREEVEPGVFRLVACKKGNNSS